MLVKPTMGIMTTVSFYNTLMVHTGTPLLVLVTALPSSVTLPGQADVIDIFVLVNAIHSSESLYKILPGLIKLSLHELLLLFELLHSYLLSSNIRSVCNGHNLQQRRYVWHHLV